MEEFPVSLSTFSFNCRSSKTIIFAFFGFFLYSLALCGFNPKITLFQNQWIKNYSVAEIYIYKLGLPRIVIVGSSMSACLLEEKLSMDVYNLSFSGGSALTGLNIIKKSNKIPDVIFIETNVIERKSNKDMLDNLFTPVIWKIKGKMLSLQHTYQPINIALTLIRNYFGSSQTNRINRKPNEKVLKDSLIRQHQANSCVEVFVDSEELIELKSFINYFKKFGAKIVFFQMPVHQTILSSKRYYARQSILLKMFPQAEFNWIKKNNANKYQTGDGIHLLYKSAIEYSSVLNKIIDMN